MEGESEAEAVLQQLLWPLETRWVTLLVSLAAAISVTPVDLCSAERQGREHLFLGP